MKQTVDLLGEAETLQGMVEHVIFHNSENGYCVLRVKSQAYPELITIVGNALNMATGEHIECSGEWHHDKAYGRQFKAVNYLRLVPPTSLYEMERYLGSGLIKGIGAPTAKILIEAFGEEVFSVLENEPERLLALPGITPKRKKQMLASWSEEKSVRDIMIFLQSHGITTARAVRIYKTYGDATIATISDNPYRLVHDIQHMGFKQVDELALRLGRAPDSIERARAGIHHVLQEHCYQGHCAAEYQHLIETSTSFLMIDEGVVKNAIDDEIAAEKLILERIDDVLCVFPVVLHQAETESAEHLMRLRAGKLPWGEITISDAIVMAEKKTALILADSQKQAIQTVLQHKVSIMTGGPGVGKTTIVNSILKIIQGKCTSIALCAPTGRAAKRLSETTGLKAKTIHRLLGFSPESRTFKHDQDNPLAIDMLVVDEASMIDTILLHHLLQAIPDHAAVLFVGDVDQLPSVGAGAVLMDMIRSQSIPTVILTEIFRQAADSKIIVNAHRINQGDLPLANETTKSDFYTIYSDSTADIYNQLIDLVAERLPQYLGVDPLTEIQVLTPMNRGELGSVALNAALQLRLNGGSEPRVTKHGFTLAPGDKVIQTINNYEKDIFNGDIGYVTEVQLADSKVKISFDQRTVEYAFEELDQLNLAYAISIHKSQGSEFPVVVMLLATQHYMLLARNLLYTGVTRGKRLVVLLGEKKAVNMAVKNNRETKRITKLAQRLQAEAL